MLSIPIGRVEDSRLGSARKCPARLVTARRTVAHPEPHPTKRCIRKCPAHIAAPSGTKTSANRQKSSRIVIGLRLAERLAEAATKETLAGTTSSAIKSKMLVTG